MHERAPSPAKKAGRIDPEVVRRLWDSGLSAALPGRVRAHRLLQRCAPAWSAIAVFVFGRALLFRGFSSEELAAFWVAADEGLDIDVIGWAMSGIAVAMLVVPVVVWAALSLLKPRAGAIAGAVVLVLAVLSPGVATLITVGAPGAGNFTDRVSVLPVAVVAIVVYLGWGRLLAWTLKRSVREVADSASRAVRTLPLLLVAFLFFFYNAELWQLGVAWTVGRAAVVAAMLWTLGVLASFIVVNEHVRDEIEGDVVAGEMGRRDGRIPLRLRLNLRYVAASVQAAQASFFGVLVFFGFVMLGLVSIPEATITAWTSRPPAIVEIGPLNIPGALVKVSWVLGAFASLYMVTATAADKVAREEQLGPITSEVRSTLATAGMLEVGAGSGRTDAPTVRA
ncbi:hypothetical protein [uncultured Corynebacterium sp.]|uniref:hypothetical protein n=1 Tax=uncultured Corynebacterium sp. TaxID=159447 RepID=UPI0025E55AFD|nr:hypothetical protein [uncultured Corynebacterium sp.]